MTSTGVQIKAMQDAFPGNLDADEAEAALDVCRDVLAAGLPLVRALVAATCKVYPGFAGYAVETRQVMLAEVLNALSVANRVGSLWPAGYVPDWNSLYAKGAKK